MARESKLSCRKSKTAFVLCCLPPFCMNQSLSNSKPLSMRGIKLLRKMARLTVSSKENSHSSLQSTASDVDPLRNSRHIMHLLLNHKCNLWRPQSHILFINHTLKWKRASENWELLNYSLIILSPFSKSHSLMFLLNCKFIQYCHFVWIHFQITSHHSLYRSSEYPVLSCTLPCRFTGASLQRLSTASMVFALCTNAGRRHFLSKTEP